MDGCEVATCRNSIDPWNGHSGFILTLPDAEELPIGAADLLLRFVVLIRRRSLPGHNSPLGLKSARIDPLLTVLGIRLGRVRGDIVCLLPLLPRDPETSSWRQESRTRTRPLIWAKTSETRRTQVVCFICCDRFVIESRHTFTTNLNLRYLQLTQTQPATTPNMAWTADKVPLPELAETSVDLDRKARQLADLIRKSKHFIVFTGAGVSTSAGIPDFRGPDGQWTLQAQGRQRTTATVTTLQAIPTATHMALVELQNRGLMTYLVSQNCDGLHRRSGILPVRTLLNPSSSISSTQTRPG